MSRENCNKLYEKYAALAVNFEDGNKVTGIYDNGIGPSRVVKTGPLVLSLRYIH